MLLCDIGNTSLHFLDKQKDYKKSVKSFDPKTITQEVYYICVNPDLNHILKKLDNWIDISCYVDMTNYYDTMGIDRIMACEAIKDGVVIDAGSAITVDVVDDGVFMGGFIYPGVEAMSKTYKDISILLDYPFNFELSLDTLAKNSQDAISYGFLKTLYLEVISHKKDIFLTGGDAKRFKTIFPHAKLDENIVFKGMKKVISQR
jgi:type III pantothenate kinase